MTINNEQTQLRKYLASDLGDVIKVKDITLGKVRIAMAVTNKPRFDFNNWRTLGLTFLDFGYLSIYLDRRG